MFEDRIAELAAFSLCQIINSCFGDLVRFFDCILQSFVLALKGLEPFVRCLEVATSRGLRSQRSMVRVSLLQHHIMNLDPAITITAPIEAALDRFAASWWSLR